MENLWPRENMDKVLETDLNEYLTLFRVQAPAEPVCHYEGLSEQQVVKYLQKHESFFWDYVGSNISIEKLEKWIDEQKKKVKTNNVNEPDIHVNARQWKIFLQSKNIILKDLIHPSTSLRIIWELCAFTTRTIQADNFNLYIADHDDSKTFYKHMGYSCTDLPFLVKMKFENDTAVQYVAQRKETLRLKSRSTNSLRSVPKNEQDFENAMYQSIELDGDLVAVVGFYRKQKDQKFEKLDEELSENYLFWGGLALHYSQLLLRMDKQKKSNDFFLAVVRSIFQEMVSTDIIVAKITHFAQRLVNADRASLFLVDLKSQEIYAKIFNTGEKAESKDTCNNNYIEIRFPLGKGIAGQVALLGQILNIKNVDEDTRFNPSIDEKPGYKTKNLLCVPISVNGIIIGVMEMVNKTAGIFNSEDENWLEIFAVYCGLALHNAQQCEKYRRSVEKHRITLEVLNYHNTCSEEDVVEITNSSFGSTPGIDDFYFDTLKYDDFRKAQFAIDMFFDLFGKRNFDSCTLARFVLTVKKNYRSVPYHNWTHGFSVANSVYCLIKKSSRIFHSNEALALFIGCLCHDLDHRGKNNTFMMATASPLARIYTTSTMEHHHFNQTIAILQKEGHNVFSSLSNENYKTVLCCMKHCILATDLAIFFSYKNKLASLLDENIFSWDIYEHRKHVLAIVMTASDLSASAKPWEIQFQTAKVIFEEFYQQGEAEMESSKTPLPIMDRRQSHQQAIFQADFISSICIPCYSLLFRLIPSSKPLLDSCKRNLEKWQKMANDIIPLK